MKLSIIVPMFNETAVLPDLLAHLLPLQRSGSEVLLVDGGSHDGSTTMARTAGFTVINADKGRARQMNTGAREAKGDVLLFLHADTRLPDRATRLVVQALTGSRKVWGRFDVHITGQSPTLRLVAWMMNWRSRCTGIATGDQAIFVRRTAFQACGGFPDQPLMEDIELSRRLKRRSAPICIAERACTSGRRWESRGVWRTIFLMWQLRLAYWLGASADSIARTYR